MTDAYKKIYRQEGLRGFWSGVQANVVRNAIFNASELASYDHAREYVLFHKLMK